MRPLVGLLVTSSLSVVCRAGIVRSDPDDTAANVVGAEEFVDAFYSFDPARLRRTLSLTAAPIWEPHAANRGSQVDAVQGQPGEEAGGLNERTYVQDGYS
jgi:hypothetical protein